MSTYERISDPNFCHVVLACLLLGEAKFLVFKFTENSASLIKSLLYTFKQIRIPDHSVSLTLLNYSGLRDFGLLCGNLHRFVGYPSCQGKEN